MDKLFYVALGGIFGSTSRYLLAGFVQQLTGSSFPHGTVFVNLLGSLLFGFVWGIFESRIAFGNFLTAELRLLVLTGFMGSLTTFSTLTMEGLALLQSAQWFQAAFYIVGQVCAGIFLVWLGISLGRMI